MPERPAQYAGQGRLRPLTGRIGRAQSIARRAVDHPSYAVIRLAQRTPGGLRHVVARGLLAVAAASGQRGDPLRLVGLDLSGQRPAALAFGDEIAGSPVDHPRRRFALARTAVAIGAPALAERLIRDVTGPEAERRGALVLRADVNLRTGHYRTAGWLIEQARRAGARGREVELIRRRAASEVQVLQPNWRPTLGGGPRRIEAVSGRVLHLVTNSLPHRQAGYTVRSQSIGRAQLGVGLEPHFATQAGFPRNEGLGGVRPEDRIDGVTYHRLDPDFDRLAGPEAVVTRTAEVGSKLVERLRPAVLHPATNFHNAQAALALRDRFGIPVVYEVRGFLEETWASRQDDDDRERAENADRYQGTKAVETACMLAADAIVTLSDTMRADIVARGVAPDRVTVVPNAVDIERFTPQAPSPALAASLGLEPGRPVLGYVSSFTGYEGIRYLVSAAALLRDRGRPVHVLLVGDGEERAALEAQAAELDLLADRTVIFTGRVPHDRVLAHYALIDVFVVPRTADRVSQLVTPLKPYEAMALERALVVSGVDALCEIVTDGETGLTFEPENAVSLAETVEPLLGDAARRAALGQRARAWVASHRTWRQNGERYLELYRRLGVA